MVLLLREQTIRWFRYSCGKLGVLWNGPHPKKQTVKFFVTWNIGKSLEVRTLQKEI